MIKLFKIIFINFDGFSERIERSWVATRKIFLWLQKIVHVAAANFETVVAL